MQGHEYCEKIKYKKDFFHLTEKDEQVDFYDTRTFSFNNWGGIGKQLCIVEISRDMPVSGSFKKTRHGIGNVWSGGFCYDPGISGHIPNRYLPAQA